MPYQSFMPSPPQPVYFAPDFATGIRSRRENALENRKLEYLMQNNALTQQSAQEKTQREQEKFAEEKRKTGLQESDKVREWQAGLIAQSSPDQVSTPEKMGMLFGGVNKIHPDISNLFHQNPQQAYQIIKGRFGKQQEPVKPITLEEQYTDLGKREETKAKYAKPTEAYGPVKQGLDESGKSIFFKISKTDPSDIQVVKGVTPEPKKGMKIYDREGNLMVDTSGGAGVAGMERKTLGTIEEKIIAAKSARIRTTNIINGFDPSFLTAKGKLKGWALDMKSKFEMGTISPEDKVWYDKFTTFTQDAIENINLYIKELTGAQMSEAEAKRLRKAVADAGDGVLSGDSPLKFWTKITNSLKKAKLSEMRFTLLREKGFKIETEEALQQVEKKYPDEKIMELYKARAEEIGEQIELSNPGWSVAQVRQEVKKQMRERYGM